MTNINDAWVKSSTCTEYYPVQQPKVKNGALIEALQHFQNVQSKPTVLTSDDKWLRTDL